jgi:hypothetical protein
VYITDVIPAKRWKNIITGKTASIYGALPWTIEAKRPEWNMEQIGWTWKMSNGTIGFGRPCTPTKEEAEEIMSRFNKRTRGGWDDNEV